MGVEPTSSRLRAVLPIRHYVNRRLRILTVISAPWSYTESNRVVNACKARPLPQLLSPISEIRCYRSPVLSYSCERKVFAPYLALVWKPGGSRLSEIVVSELEAHVVRRNFILTTMELTHGRSRNKSVHIASRKALGSGTSTGATSRTHRWWVWNPLPARPT